MNLEDTINLSSKTFMRKRSGDVLEFYISGEITNPEDYVEWYDAIRNTSENDAIRIYINSYGGNVSTALQFLRCLSEAKAEVTCSIEGECMSAATMIFLAGDVLEVTPHSQIMIHNYSGGAIGKGNEMHAKIEFEKAWATKFLKDIYADFLSEDEINNVLKGQDLWLDSDETALRCQYMLEAREAKYAAMLEAVAQQ